MAAEDYFDLSPRDEFETEEDNMPRQYLGIVQRQNPMGLRYTVSQDEAAPETRSVVSMGGKKLSINMPMQDLLQGWYNWQMQDMLIQNAFPTLSPEEREFLITGITPHEWRDIFKEPDCGEEE